MIYISSCSPAVTFLYFFFIRFVLQFFCTCSFKNREGYNTGTLDAILSTTHRFVSLK